MPAPGAGQRARQDRLPGMVPDGIRAGTSGTAAAADRGRDREAAHRVRGDAALQVQRGKHGAGRAAREPRARRSDGICLRQLRSSHRGKAVADFREAQPRIHRVAIPGSSSSRACRSWPATSSRSCRKSGSSKPRTRATNSTRRSSATSTSASRRPTGTCSVWTTCEPSSGAARKVRSRRLHARSPPRWFLCGRSMAW
jgi:hypothetical protein